MSGAPAGVLIYAAASVVLVTLGVRALIARRHLLAQVLAVNVLGAGVFLLLVALARRAPDGPPDPVPHTLVLTGLVVAVSLTALAVALVRRLHAETGADTLEDGGGAP